MGRLTEEKKTKVIRAVGEHNLNTLPESVLPFPAMHWSSVFRDPSVPHASHHILPTSYGTLSIADNSGLGVHDLFMQSSDGA